MLGPATLPGASRCGITPRAARCRSAAIGMTSSISTDGRVALIVGDCVGHGLAAATVMGQLRSACRALLLEKSSPSAVLAGLDRFAARLPGAECTTAFCAVLTLATGELVYSTAGHPPAIMVHADGTTAMLEGGRGLPLATGGPAPDPKPMSRCRRERRCCCIPTAWSNVAAVRSRMASARAADLVRDGRSQDAR